MKLKNSGLMNDIIYLHNRKNKCVEAKSLPKRLPNKAHPTVKSSSNSEELAQQ